MKRFFGVSALLFVAAAVLVAFSLGIGVKGAQAENVIKVGCAISFTGKKSRSGKLYVDSYNMAVEKINESGGVKVGNKNYKIKIIYYDDKSSADESAKLVEKLISEN